MNVFIDTQDMEERYGEQLYQDYLVELNKELQTRINKAIEYIGNKNIGVPRKTREKVIKILKGGNE